MENTEENQTTDESLKDLPVQTENIAYGFDEMIACGKCQRNNPPNRLKCLYCGAELEFSDEQSGLIKPVLRKLEAWEKGFNLIYMPNDLVEINAQKIKEISRMTRLEKEVLEKFFDAKKPLPLARAESEKEAEIVCRRFDEIGVETIILSDEQLAVETPPKRLRKLEFADDKIVLKLFNTNETVKFLSEDLTLIVTGAIFQKRVEATEKHNKKGENVLLNATETATDERLIDIYSRDYETGFRIEQKGFDFSCLGEEKSLLAVENIEKLASKLKAIAPDAKFVNNYLQLRALIGKIWEIAERKDSKGLVRESFGKFNLGNVTTVSNLEQFTKYSRMLKNVL
ncbi:MAG: hypothetical protein ACR2F2_01780 [Pyrinomonadaceae bacterium]